jgi:transcriptional regulator with XRE-family HTH domain
LTFAETLRQLRVESFLSQSELGRRAGLHALTITRLESSASAPTTRTVRALAAALGVEPRRLAAPEEVAELRRALAGAARRTELANQPRDPVPELDGGEEPADSKELS